MIPAFNEAQAIGLVVEKLRNALPEAELIVVNDGSTDETGPIAEKAGAIVIEHAGNHGYGASLRTGIENASRDYVLSCDADGQHSAEDVVRLIEACDGCDMVVGARGEASHVPLLRRPGKFILRRFADYLAGTRIPDLNSGLRIVRKDLLLKYMHLMPRGFSFSTTVTFAMLKTHRSIKWVPITVSKRIGKSTVKQLRHGSQTLMLILRLTILFEPLKVFLVLAGSLFGLGVFAVVLNLVVSKGRHLGSSPVLLFLAALIIFLFGLLCDQVSALRREIHD